MDEVHRCHVNTQLARVSLQTRHLLHHLAAQQVVRQPMTRGQDDDAVMYDLLGTKEYRSLHLRSYALCGQ
ncbi:hypothetical protein KAT72_05350 [Aeromonas popoffii]|uniref:Uncharacterized protein n=1 Tax=Aeromonas popoffii TaxID=70856 RepID=A0ABS5GMY1_9GAMM|nr:hypothetical protein [Aeromonas popoffii]MBR7628472.1 hypothetical protein [Aeromonas popoffii]